MNSYDFFIHEFICFMNSYMNSGVPRFQMPAPAGWPGRRRSFKSCWDWKHWRWPTTSSIQNWKAIQIKHMSSEYFESDHLRDCKSDYHDQDWVAALAGPGPAGMPAQISLPAACQSESRMLTHSDSESVTVTGYRDWVDHLRDLASGYRDGLLSQVKCCRQPVVSSRGASRRTPTPAPEPERRWTKYWLSGPRGRGGGPLRLLDSVGPRGAGWPSLAVRPALRLLGRAPSIATVTRWKSRPRRGGAAVTILRLLSQWHLCPGHATGTVRALAAVTQSRPRRGVTVTVTLTVVGMMPEFRVGHSNFDCGYGRLHSCKSWDYVGWASRNGHLATRKPSPRKWQTCWFLVLLLGIRQAKQLRRARKPLQVWFFTIIYKHLDHFGAQSTTFKAAVPRNPNKTTVSWSESTPQIH